MHPRILRDVLVHHVGHHVHRFNAIQRGPPLFGSASRMGRDSGKAELRRPVRQRRVGRGRVAIPRMPVNGNINVFEQTRSDHVDLAGAALLGRCAIDADTARCPALFQPVPNGDGSRDRPRPEQIVPAGVTGKLAIDTFARWQGRLVDTWQRVHFGQQRDDRTTRAVFGHEGGRNICHAWRYSEACI